MSPQLGRDLPRALLAALALSLAPRAASADDKSACLAASTEGQTLRNLHKLLEARDQLRICARRECPGVVQRDCGEWLDSVEKSLPTIVLSAKGRAGQDLFDVAVTVDGKPLTTRLDGQAVPLNPGPHSFRFELPDGTSRAEDVLVREGEKMHGVSVVLEGARAAKEPDAARSDAPQARPGPGSDEAPAHSTRTSTQRIVGLVTAGVGAVGLGVGVAVGLAAKSSDDTAEKEAGNARSVDSGRAVSLGNAGTVVFVAGAVTAAAGIVVWLTAPSRAISVGTNGRGVFLGGSF